MTTKQYLGQLVNIDRRIKDQMSEYEKWISIATSTGSNSANTDRVMSSGSQDKMADAVAKAIDYSIESNENAILLTNLKHTITNQICGIKNEQFYNVLFSHFVDGEKIDEIKLGKYDYSYKQKRRILLDAMDEFERKYGEEYLNNN